VFARGLWAPGRWDLFPAFLFPANYLQGRIWDAGRADGSLRKLNFMEYDNTDHLAWVKMDSSLLIADLRGQLLLLSAFLRAEGFI
jgi:hypothetical protein